MELRTRVRFSSAELVLWDRTVLGFAILCLGALFWRHALLASRVVDGTRYFLLDDDMMISMRYGRNLAEGHGLVWNAGERVEGYTNFLWTVIMGGAHLLPVGEAKLALVIKALGFVLLSGTLYLALRLLRLFVPRSFVAAPILLVATVCCVDVLHWAAWGFETSLLGFLLLLFLVLLLEERSNLLAFSALSLVPLVRADGLSVFAAGALAAIAIGRSPRTTLLWLAAALVPFAMHLAFRHAYYGEWLPNTYYLKVHGLDGKYARGTAYVRSFLLRYSVPLTLATGGAVAIGWADRRGLAFFAVLLPTLLYVVTTGGDMFGNFRFFAHVMPLVFVFAAAAAVKLARGRFASVVLAGVLLATSVPLVRPMSVLVAMDTNGDPYDQIQVAMLLRKNARPDSTIAVMPAGIVPYFTRLRAVDVLGKTDKHVARLTPYPGAMVGHGKLDPDYSLATRPDLVISCRSHPFVMSLTAEVRTQDVILSFLASSIFQRDYRPNPIQEPFLLARTAIYAHAGSRELATRTWQSVEIAP